MELVSEDQLKVGFRSLRLRSCSVIMSNEHRPALMWYCCFSLRSFVSREEVRHVYKELPVPGEAVLMSIYVLSR